jgi:hypothetical protein
MLLLNVSANPEILQFHPDHPGPQVNSTISIHFKFNSFSIYGVYVTLLIFTEDLTVIQIHQGRQKLSAFS